MITDPVAVLVVLAAVVVVALLLEKHFVVFRSLGAALVGILVGMLLSNTGILPGTSPTYDFLVGPGVSLGIVLILMSIDVRSIVQAGPKMLAAFGIGALGTAIGSTVSGLFLFQMVGPETWKLAGQFTGTYTGGGANYAAVGQALGTSSDLFSAALAADVVVTAIWLSICLAVPALLGNEKSVKKLNQIELTPEEKPFTLEQALYSSGRPVSLVDAAVLVFIGVGIVWVSGQLGKLLSMIPDVLWLTTIVLLVAQVPVIRRLSGGTLWGNYLILLFLASNGASSVLANIIEIGPAVFYFALGTVTLHGLFIFGVGSLVRIDLATLAVASQANVGGPASAMALASARGYVDRLLPGVAVGLLGYAIGNYCGIAIALFVHGLLGG